MDSKEMALKKFEEGYNCAQAISCTFASDMNLSEEDAYRISEGFGGGLGHSGYTCGVCSAMVMVASYKLCPHMEHIGETKQKTYPIIEKMVKKFIEDNHYVNCADILANGNQTLINGKKTCCRNCVKSVCEQLEKMCSHA